VAGLIVWTVLIGATLASIGLTVFLWFTWYQKTKIKERTQIIEREINTYFIYAIVATLVALGEWGLMILSVDSQPGDAGFESQPGGFFSGVFLPVIRDFTGMVCSIPRVEKKIISSKYYIFKDF
jgi:hypothetical protein